MARINLVATFFSSVIEACILARDTRLFLGTLYREDVRRLRFLRSRPIFPPFAFALPLASTTIVIATFENTSWRFVPYQRHMCIISATLQASLASCCLSYRGKHVRKRLSCSSGSSQERTVQSESIISKGRERGRERTGVGFGLCGRRSAPIWPT